MVNILTKDGRVDNFSHGQWLESERERERVRVQEKERKKDRGRDTKHSESNESKRAYCKAEKWRPPSQLRKHLRERSLKRHFETQMKGANWVNELFVFFPSPVNLFIWLERQLNSPSFLSHTWLHPSSPSAYWVTYIFNCIPFNTLLLIFEWFVAFFIF